MDPLPVSVQVQRVECHDLKDGIGVAEPYLWTVFFKVDGDTALVDDSLTLQGTATVLAPPASRDTLGERAKQMRAGDVVPVPPTIGEYHTTLVPIPLTTPFLDHSFIAGGIGCVVALLEQDSSREQEVTQAHATLTNAIQTALNLLLASMNFSTREIKGEISQIMHQRVRAEVARAAREATERWEARDSWRNDDDFIGYALWYCAANDLAAAGPEGRSFTQHWRSSGEWTITGRIATRVSSSDTSSDLPEHNLPQRHRDAEV